MDPRENQRKSIMGRLHKYCIRTIKSRMKWAGHVVGMRDMGRRELYLGNLKERYYFRELDVDGIIILKCILYKEPTRCYFGSIVY